MAKKKTASKKPMGRNAPKTRFERKPARAAHDGDKQAFEEVDVPVPDPDDLSPPSRTARIERKSA